MHTALITGGTAGIGYGIAEILAQQGVDLVVSYLHNDDRAIQVKERLSSYGVKVQVIKANTGLLGDLKTLFQKVENSTGFIDILINNIGSSFPDDKEENSDWEDMFHHHLMGSVSATELFQNQLGDRQGCIINITSVLGVEPLLQYKGARLEAYCCMKAAVNMYTKIAANKFAGKIRVNAIAPGNTETEGRQGADENFKKARRKGILIQRFIQPQEIGDMAYQIIKNKALNGQVFVVDGGVVGKGYE